MTDNEMAHRALAVMETMGFPRETVRPVLKNLWKLYDKNWKLIEEGNFQVLAEALLEGVEKKEEESGTSSKRTHKTNLEDQNSHYVSKRVKVEADQLQTFSEKKSEDSSKLCRRRNGKDLIDEIPLARKILPDISINEQFFCDEDPQPIAVCQPSDFYSSQNEGSVPLNYSNVNISGKSNHKDEVGVSDAHIVEFEKDSEVPPVSSEADSSRPDIATRNLGFKMPSLDSFLSAVQDDVLKSKYSICSPDIPKLKLLSFLKETYQCFKKLGTGSNDNKIKIQTTLSSNLCLSQHNSINRAPNGLGRHHLNNSSVSGLSNGDIDRENHLQSSEPSNFNSLADPRQQIVNRDEVCALHDVNDISKGTERVKISVVNDISDEKCPPKFHYIPHNTVYQNAYINFALARIGDEDSCSSCFGDCLSPNVVPCACARETSGEFAYTIKGLVREDLLDVFISMSRESYKHHHVYCKECPIEKARNEVNPDRCKGHLVRKFIKECWHKCGCNIQCGNRIVQRGITCNLQVFMTPENKGWGLRTLKNLPKGAFVCEYVGEIVTNTELYDRNLLSIGDKRHTYPVYLDADWGSEAGLKDEEALCLDATFFGNIARFINHRCCDSNLVEIPVEVETPDRHYYHLAFFTARDIYALEELTWDYGIDFDDDTHPIEAFKCKCGSPKCKDMHRKNRDLSKALVVR